MLEKRKRRLRRARRVRYNLSKQMENKNRLSIFRSSKNIHVQLIDDSLGKTLLSASTISKDFFEKLGNDNKQKNRRNKSSAIILADIFASKLSNSSDLKDKPIVFDRGYSSYVGVIKHFTDRLRSLGVIL